jgi:cobalt-zinc-cadmium efflux system outer membrane protein
MRCIASLRCAGLVAAGLSVPLGGHAQAPAPYPLGGELPAFEAGRQAAASPSMPDAAEPEGVLHLRDALAAALLRNPALMADAYEIRAREAARLQARAFPNPTASLELEDFAGTGDFRGVRESQTTLLLGQLVELGGKRAARQQIAAAEGDLAAWDFEMRRIEVLAQAAAAFVDVLAAQERRRLADESLELARSVQRVAGLRLRAGLASPAEEIRSQVLVDVAEVEREHTEHELATARQLLAATWAGETPRFERAEGDLTSLPAVPPEEVLAARLASSPGMTRWQAELSRREALRARARGERVPDPTFTLGPRYHAGPDDAALVAGVQLPLPLWNRNRAAIDEAELELSRSAAAARGARVRAVTELATARVALHASAEEAMLLRTRVLPGVERALEIVRRGYESGRFAQVEVLDAERARIEAREQYVRALTEAHHSAQEIERLTGVALEVRP